MPDLWRWSACALAAGIRGGGMCAIRFHDNGDMEGAACWRADGTPIGVGGGHARRGVRFLPEARVSTVGRSA